jgi:hypothetical protein
VAGVVSATAGWAPSRSTATREAHAAAGGESSLGKPASGSLIAVIGAYNAVGSSLTGTFNNVASKL